MPCQITYDPKIDCVVNTISGDLDKNLVGNFFMEVGKVAAENNCRRMLSYLRTAKIVAPATDIYDMASSLEKLQIQRTFRRAIVISQDHKDYAFWETVCYNQGHQIVKIFHNYEKAKDWVLMK